MPPNTPPSLLVERALQPPITQWVAAYGKKILKAPVYYMVCLIY